MHRLNLDTLEEKVVYRHPTPVGGTRIVFCRRDAAGHNASFSGF